MLWIILAVAYLGSAIAVTVVGRAAIDPYEHFTPMQNWSQAALIGAFWPLWLVLLGAWLLYVFIFDKD